MPAQRSGTLKWLLPLILTVAVVCVVVVIVQRRAGAYKPPPLAFDGSSDELKQTAIVPTLDTPMPPGKNVIWCACFQLAWNEFRDDVIGEPVKIEGAQEIADRLNNSPITKDVLEPDDYYAKAGYIEGGIMQTIERDMHARFPDVPRPDIPISDITIAVAYSYLQADAHFKYAFDEYDGEWLFGEMPVRGFGVHDRSGGRVPDDVRRQVEVLYCSSGPEDRMSPSDDEYIIDPCRHTRPYQVILARVERQPTLTETLARVKEAIAARETPWHGGALQERDILLVPILRWRLEHQFLEIQGTDKPLLNRGHEGKWLGVALQRIDFELLRTGARLRSEALIDQAVGRSSPPRKFLFNQPFLLVMKKRGAERPFLVMWVDNAELLCKP